MELPTPLAPFADRPGDSALLVDFDGSLAPIVDDPARAVPLPETVAALGALSADLRVVAVVSGRPVGYLADHLSALDTGAVTLVGLYGLERRVGGSTVVDPRAEPWAEPIAAAADAAEAALPGLLVERKGRLCVTIHYRTAPGRATEARAVADALAARYGIEAPLRGRMAVELRPPVPVDKGTVVRELAVHAQLAAFAGDDAGDVAAFDALSSLVSEGALDAGVRIGVASPESPLEILDADVVVDGPRGLAALLEALAGAISARAG